MAKVCLDAGHYGKYNRSPVNPAYFESVQMWKLTEYLASELQKNGVSVFLTRTEQDKDLPLIARGQKAKGCDLLISLHSNASVSASTDYPVALIMRDNDFTDVDERSEEIGMRLAKVVENVMDTKQEGRVASSASNNDRDGNGKKDDEYYGVLQGAKIVGVPGVIMEHSFHTNAKATAWLLNDSNLRKLAKAEAECISDYLNGEEEMTQEQFEKMLDEYLAKRAKMPASAWAVKEIASAKAKGITDGSAPRGFITREECMAMVDRAANMIINKM